MALDMSQHFSTGRLIRFTLPSIAMMIFTSVYTVVDGLFVSNFAGATPFAALNFVFPVVMILGTVGFMMGTGGSAIVAKTRGEGDDDRANRYFSMLVVACIVFGAIFAALGLVIVGPVSGLMGASGEMLDDCILYGSALLVALPAFVLQYAFGSFFMTAGKPNMGFAFTVAAGVTNIVLDAVLVGALGMGLLGAAIATDLGMVAGGVGPIIYFARENDSCLRLVRPRLEWRVLGRTCVNGSSEMVGNIAMSVVAMCYNVQLLSLIGEDGVAAYGVVMYVSMIFNAVFIGYAMGAAPLMSFQYGAQNRVEMRSLFRKGVAIVVVAGLAMFGAAELAAGLLSDLFVGYDQGLRDLTELAFRIFSFSFIFMGFNIFGSSLFTALNNGIISAIISFVRTLVFEIGAVFLLPMIVGPNGIWGAIIVAEVASVVLALVFIIKLERRYGYIRGR